MRVLVADDDPLGVTILSRALERWGFDVAVAHDGEEAWRIIQQDDQPAIAILDWVMPAPDGLELCRRIRSDESRAHLHVILLTAREGRADLMAGLDAGADDYLTKPFDADELRARVNVGARIVTLQRRLSRRVTELQAALAHVKQLSGLLPICSYCKRIRSDQNYWQQLESYISEHSDAEFSHAICPECYEEIEAKFALGITKGGGA
jgi:DNA-binding response OmpR family regulator